MSKVLSTTGRFSGKEGLTGNLFSGEDSFLGLLILSGALHGDFALGDGVVRLFSIFNGEADSRSLGLFVVTRGEMFSEFSEASETFATNGELGGPSVSVSVSVSVLVNVCEVHRTSYSWLETFLGVTELRAASPVFDKGDAMPIVDDT